jgi:hypothetical protein
MIYRILLLLFIFPATLLAQSISSTNDKVDILPSYPAGGFDGFSFVNMSYPKSSTKKGMVDIAFTVEGDGSLSDVKILKGIDAAIDAEALRIVNLTDGDWNPAMKNNKPVRLRIVESIKFYPGNEVKDNVDQIFASVSILPEYPDGKQALEEFLEREFECPPSEVSMREKCLKNKSAIIVQLVIGADGTPREHNVVKGLSYLMDREALRVVKEIKYWKPAQTNGKTVACRMIIEVNPFPILKSKH